MQRSGGIAMQPGVTLRYARAEKRRTRHRTIILVLVGVISASGSYLGYYAYEDIRARVILLNSDPRLGPIDWSTVLTSPALCRLAWEFSSDRTAISRLGNDATGVVGISLLGTDPNNAEIDLEFPLSYAEGQLKLRFTIRNKGRNTLLVPPFGQPMSWFRKPATKGATGSPQKRARELGLSNSVVPWRTPQSQLGWPNFYDIPLSVAPRQQGLSDLVYVQVPSLSVACFVGGGLFSKGVRVLKPDERKTVELSVRAPEHPVGTSIWLQAGRPATGPSLTFWFEIDVADFLLGRCTNWEEVPREAMRKEQQFLELPPLRA